MMRKEMNPNRKIAIIVGVFYIVSALGLLSLLTFKSGICKSRISSCFIFSNLRCSDIMYFINQNSFIDGYQAGV